MNDDEARTIIIQAMREVAPEVDLGSVPPQADLRDELDIDSMDFLNFIVGLHEKTGIDVPEEDYEHFATLQGAIDYVVRRADAAA